MGTIPAPCIGGAAKVLPALFLIPRRDSLVGGEGQFAEVAVEDVDIGGMGTGGIVSAPVGVDGGCRCNCEVALAGVRRGMVREVKKMKEELMGAITMLLAERGLGTWEKERRLENTRAKLVREREVAEKAHGVSKMAAQFSA